MQRSYKADGYCSLYHDTGVKVFPEEVEDTVNEETEEGSDAAWDSFLKVAREIDDRTDILSESWPAGIKDGDIPEHMNQYHSAIIRNFQRAQYPHQPYQASMNSNQMGLGSQPRLSSLHATDITQANQDTTMDNPSRHLLVKLIPSPEDSTLRPIPQGTTCREEMKGDTLSRSPPITPLLWTSPRSSSGLGGRIRPATLDPDSVLASTSPLHAIS